MEAAKCRLCGERHYGLCKQFQEVVQKPLKKIKEKISESHSSVLFMEPAKLKTEGTPVVREVEARIDSVLTGNLCLCPCCVIRRQKTLAAVKKHREKKRGH